MNPWFSFLIGILVLPALTGLGFLHIKLIMRDGVHSVSCGACDFETHRERPIVRWVKWRWHDVTRGWRKAHRETVREYQRKWGLGRYDK